MKNGDGVGARRDAEKCPTEGKAVRTCGFCMEQADGSVWLHHGVCSLLPGGTVAGDMARAAVVIAVGGWDGKQPRGRGYKSARN